MGDTVLEARGVGKRFGAVVAADAIDIAFRQGERVSIIGGNGAGKTTFVNMVTGYLRPDCGSFLLCGRDISSLAHMDIARLGLARSFQIPQLFLDMTVHNNVYVALVAARRMGTLLERPSRLDEAVGEVLARFNLADRAGDLAGTLPSGLRKLLDIAMASVLQPKVLMLDEPTSGVSAEEKHDLMRLVLDALGDDGRTLVFIEHDMDIVRGYSERAIAFYSGSVIADGPVADVLARHDVRQYITGDE